MALYSTSNDKMQVSSFGMLLLKQPVFNVVIEKSDYDIKILIVMQKEILTTLTERNYEQSRSFSLLSTLLLPGYVQKWSRRSWRQTWRCRWRYFNISNPT